MSTTNKTFRVVKLKPYEDRYLAWLEMDRCEPHCGCSVCCDCNICETDRRRNPEDYKDRSPTYAEWKAMEPKR